LIGLIAAAAGFEGCDPPLPGQLVSSISRQCLPRFRHFQQLSPMILIRGGGSQVPAFFRVPFVFLNLAHCPASENQVAERVTNVGQCKLTRL